MTTRLGLSFSRATVMTEHVTERLELALGFAFKVLTIARIYFYNTIAH